MLVFKTSGFWTSASSSILPVLHNTGQITNTSETKTGGSLGNLKIKPFKPDILTDDGLSLLLN